MADVVQHCFGNPGGGGPATALQRLLESSQRDYPVLWQSDAAGGISIRLIARFVRELRRHRPQLVHVRGLGNEGFHGVIAARLAGVPNVLVSIHGTHRDLRLGRGRLRRWIVANVLERATLRFATAVVAVCEAMSARDFLIPYTRKILPPVPNGVPIPDLRGECGSAVRSALGIAADRLIAVIVSRLTFEKGFGDLARALKGLDSRIGFDVIVVGDGSERGAIQSLFRGLQNIGVHFVGQQRDVSPYFAAADLFLLPSWHENLSNALLEAMAHGLPAITTRVGGNIEVIAGGGGLLVNPHDPGQIASAVLELLVDSEKRQRLGAAARANIEANYSLERMVSNWESTYCGILGSQT